MATKAFEIRLYPNKEQQLFFNKTFGCCRFVYNHCLWLKASIYEETYLSFDPKLKSFKEEWPWLREADSQGLANAYMDMKKAYQNFFDIVDPLDAIAWLNERKKIMDKNHTTQVNMLHVVKHLYSPEEWKHDTI